MVHELVVPVVQAGVSFRVKLSFCEHQECGNFCVKDYIGDGNRFSVSKILLDFEANVQVSEDFTENCGVKLIYLFRLLNSEHVIFIH